MSKRDKSLYIEDILESANIKMDYNIVWDLITQELELMIENIKTLQ